MNSALQFVVGFLLELVCFLFMARFLLQACGADFYNPISQGIVKATDPFLRPLRSILPHTETWTWRPLRRLGRPLG